MEQPKTLSKNNWNNIKTQNIGHNTYQPDLIKGQLVAYLEFRKCGNTSKDGQDKVKIVNCLNRLNLTPLEAKTMVAVLDACNHNSPDNNLTPFKDFGQRAEVLNLATMVIQAMKGDNRSFYSSKPSDSYKTVLCALNSTEGFMVTGKGYGLFGVGGTEYKVRVPANLHGDLFSYCLKNRIIPSQRFLESSYCSLGTQKLNGGELSLQDDYLASAFNSFQKLHWEKGFTLIQSMTKSSNLAKKAEACYALGVCYEQGIGVAVNMIQAAELFKEGDKLGNIQAKVRLGGCYLNGTGVEKDQNAAIVLFQDAVIAQNTQAMVEFGMCFLHGTGVPQDALVAFNLFNQATGLGNLEAMIKLGICHLQTGTEEDKQQAFKLFQQATELGNPQARFCLAKCYAYAIGTAENMKKAFKLAEEAADLGVDAALFSTNITLNAENVTRNHFGALLDNM